MVGTGGRKGLLGWRRWVGGGNNIKIRHCCEQEEGWRFLFNEVVVEGGWKKEEAGMRNSLQFPSPQPHVKKFCTVSCTENLRDGCG